MRPVAAPQCPAISFLDQLRNTSAAPVKLDLSASSLRAGQTLSGAVSELDGRDVAILTIAGDGSVRAVPTTKSGRDDATFSSRAEPGDGKLQLVLAVASPKPLTALRPGQPAPASKLFPAALAEAGDGADLTATARAFKVDK